MFPTQLFNTLVRLTLCIYSPRAAGDLRALAMLPGISAGGPDIEVCWGGPWGPPHPGPHSSGGLQYKGRPVPKPVQPVLHLASGEAQ